MKLKRHLRMFFSFLLVAVVLLSGCSPAVEDLATDVLTTIIESELEAETEDTDLTVLEEEVYEDTSAPEEETIVEEDTVIEEEAVVEEEPVTKEETVVEEEAVVEEEPVIKEETVVEEEPVIEEEAVVEEEPFIDEDGTYTSKDEVAAYIHEYGHLPSNFITKKQAKKLGWVSSEGNLGKVAPGKSIGGDYFGNYEGNLPEAKGRDYYECDIDSTGGYRGAKRIVFSDDGLIYYTEDHYETFELLYGEE